MNKTKRVLSVVLAVLMLSSLIAALAIADGQHTVIINYVFTNDKQAAPSWTATLAEGSNLEQTVTSPTVVGYKPVQATVDVTVNNITENVTYTVTYYPANVGFTVNHYLQNVADNNYTLDKTENVGGFTESEVGGDLAKTYPGFAALLYNTKAKVAADGSTVVEIYYDRNYYMMSFNLDGGYGVEPIYARYGASVKVENPTKPGYTFNGWEPTVPETVPAENTTYKAKWTPGESGFTVVFWYENANDDGYSYAGSIKPANVAPGTQKSSNDYQNENFTGRDAAHFTYNSAKAETVTVKGDGSTVLNVYFTRNTYTLTFKGGKVEVICGKEEHEHTHDGWYYKAFDGTYYYGGCYPAGSYNGLGTGTGGAKSPTCGKSEHTHINSCYKISDLIITAKYGADIHNNFPIKDGDKTIWWKVPQDTKTYGHWDNQPYLGSIDTMPGENITFTKNDSESGAKIYYYVETLNGEAGDTTYPETGADAKNYKLYKTIDLEYSSDTNLTYKEEFHPITGFTQGESKPHLPKDGKVEMQQNNYLYYTRNSYKLEFFNYNSFVTDEEQNVQYEAPLKGKDFTPAYPAGLEANAYEFAGWYTTEGCYDGSEVDWDTAKMPAGVVVVYAKWAPKNHTVKAYLTKEVVGGEAIYTYHVPHGTAVPSAPANPTNGNYTFVGWFYEENGVEKAFDFSMPVIKDLNLYAKWSSNTLVTYTIKYKLKDGTEVAPMTTGSALAGTTKTFEAKGGEELNEGYQTGFFPETNSHSIDMQVEGGNEFTFVYVAKDKVNYTVKYLEKDTNKVLHDEKTAETTHAIITEKFEQINGYAPDAYQKRLVLSATEEENVIIFWYTEDNIHAPVHVIHWLQDISGNGYTQKYQETTDLNGVIGNHYTENPLEIPGFTYNAGMSKASGTLTKDGLELNLYYDRNTYDYEFRFVDRDGNPIEGVDTVTGKARYQAQVTERAKKLEGDGWMLDTTRCSENGAINIVIEKQLDKNVYTFYYLPFYNIVHVKSGVAGDPVKTVIPNNNKDGLTDKVSDGYLYGGTFDNVDCTTVHDFGEENAINFTPIKGETYYIWEVSETYLKPRAYAVWRHDPAHNGQKNVVGLYLTTSVDRNMYQQVGFAMENNVDILSTDGTVYTKVRAVYESGDVKEEMYVKSNGDLTVTQTATDEGKYGYVGIARKETNNTAQSFNYRPYWVTLDGIKVTSAYAERKCEYQGPGFEKLIMSELVKASSNVSVYASNSTRTVGVEGIALLSVATENVAAPEVPETPVIPEIPEAPDMTLNSGAMYLRAQYTYEMMTNTVRFISAIDVNECTEYGFVINGEVVKCEEAAQTVDGYDANYLFGGSVNGAMLMSCNMLLDGLVDGMTLNVTPYYVAADGITVVYGETRTLVYRQWVGLEG